MKKESTSWGGVADWYHGMLENLDGTYQKDLILPNLLRMLDPKPGEVILDLACGQGFFSRELHKAGATVIGADIAKELIALATKHSPTSIKYHVSPADSISYLGDKSVDKVIIILALQNIEQYQATLKECARVLKTNGRLMIVLNHPAFRIPKASSWGFDDATKIQYRRLDAYMTESRQRIEMHPGADRTAHAPRFTVSFHRPLQVYFKSLQKANFMVARLEEWTSHKQSDPGPRANAEDIARKEFPMFLALDARINHTSVLG